MKKTFTKITKAIAIVLTSLIVPAIGLATTTPSPILDANNLYQIANATNMGSWGTSATATYGDTVSYLVHVHNNVIGSTANNVNVKVTLPTTNFTSYSSVATVSADNATAVTGSTTLTLSEASKLNYIPGSTIMYDHNNQVLGTLPDTIMTTGVNVGNINGCWEYETWIRFKVKVADRIPVPTCTISANPSSIIRGSSSTLTFSSANATSGLIDNSIGSVGTSGTRVVSPTISTAYTYTVSGEGGTTSCSTSVNVNEPAHYLTINGTLTGINCGDPSNFSASAVVTVLENTDNDAVQISWVVDGVSTNSGQYSFTKLLSYGVTHTVTVTVTDNGGHTATKTMTIYKQGPNYAPVVN
jgi:hypothetical protein